jgi:hypothetical protein
LVSKCEPGERTWAQAEFKSGFDLKTINSRSQDVVSINYTAIDQHVPIQCMEDMLAWFTLF